MEKRYQSTQCLKDPNAMYVILCLAVYLFTTKNNIPSWSSEMIFAHPLLNTKVSHYTSAHVTGNQTE